DLVHRLLQVADPHPRLIEPISESLALLLDERPGLGSRQSRITAWGRPPVTQPEIDDRRARPRPTNPVGEEIAEDLVFIRHRPPSPRALTLAQCTQPITLAMLRLGTWDRSRPLAWYLAASDLHGPGALDVGIKLLLIRLEGIERIAGRVDAGAGRECQDDREHLEPRVIRRIDRAVSCGGGWRAG